MTNPQEIPLSFPIEKSVLVGVTSRLEEMLITSILQQMGYVMHVVDTGAMALNAIRQHEFDAVLLDTKLFDIQKNGFLPFCDAMAYYKRKAPIIALTTENAPKLPKTESAQITAEICAPFTLEKLIKTLQNATL
jgi:CheY-like chemotaxis protein